MPDVANVTVGVDLNLAKATQDLRAFTSKKYRFALDNQFSGPLRGITGDIQSFDTSLTKATNRVVAFGAAAAVFKGAQAAFSAFAKATVEVEYSLAAINVNLNESSDGLKKFSADLFGVARQTGQSFETAAKAAEEFARQGLGAEETIKRTRDALILSRIAALDSTEAVNDLTAAVNTFSKEALTTTDILNKFVAVDTRFAVSSKDLADGLQRTGAVAADAGISLDKLIGMITAVKQATGRDGAVISNGFKTIFERARAPGTIKQFEALGIATKDLSGELLPVDKILKNLADTYDTLSQAQQQQISKSVANIQQINVFKALLTDLAKTYSVTNAAANVSANATDDAISKNIKLNQTLKTQIESTKTSLVSLFSALGDQKGNALFPSASQIAKNILGAFETTRKYLSGESGSKLGQTLGDGLLKGLSNVLTGPVAFTAIFALARAFRKVISVIGGDVKNLLGLNSIAGQRAEVQSRINDLLKQSTESEYANVRAATTVLEQKRAILAIQERINALSGSSLLTSSFIKPGFLGTKIEGLNAKGKVPSFASVPNFVNPMQGFGKGATLLGKGLFGNVLQNSKRKDLVFKQFTGGFDATQSSGPNSIENEYLASKALEQAGVPVAKVRGSLSRSVARGGLFKEKVDGLEGNDIADSVGYPILNGVIASLKDKVKAAGLEPYDLHGGNFMVKGGVSEEAAALRAGASKEDIIQRLVAKSKIIDPGMFNFKDYTKYDSLKSALTGSSGRKSSEADTFHSPMGTNAFTGERLRSAFPQNFADPLSAAIGREMAAGVPKHLIYVDKDRRLVSPENPSGLLVANRRDEPVGGFQGINRVLSQGGDPKNAGMMRVPHFADSKDLQRILGLIGPGATPSATIAKGVDISNISADVSPERIRAQIKTLLIESLDISKGDIRGPVKTQFNKLLKDVINIKGEDIKQLASSQRAALIKSLPGGGATRALITGERGVTNLSGSTSDIEAMIKKQVDARLLPAQTNKAVLSSRPRTVPEAQIAAAMTGDIVQVTDTRSTQRRFGGMGSSALNLLNTGNTRGRGAALVGSEQYDTPIGPSFQSFRDNQIEEVRAKAVRADATRKRLEALVEERRSKQFGEARESFLGSTPSIFGSRKTDVKKLGALGLDATSDAGQALLKDRGLQRIQRRGNIALGASFIAPLVAGFIPEGKGGTAGGQLSGAASGALQGASIGGIFGPIGIAVGAAGGAIIGALGKASKSLEEFSQEIDDASAAQAKVVDSTQRVRGIGSEIKDLRESGGDPRAIARLLTQRTETIQGVGDTKVRERLARAADNPDEINKIYDEQLAISKRLDSGGNVSLTSKSINQDSFQTKVGKGLAAPEKLLKYLLGDVGVGLGNAATGGLTGYLAKAGKLNIEEGSKKNITEDIKDQQTLTKSIGRSLTDENIKGIDLKTLNNGGGSDDDIKKLTDAFASLGAQVDVTTDNYRTTVAALNDAVTGFKRIKKITDEVTKTQLIGFGRNAFSQQANLGTISQAALTGRAPGANSGQRAESRFDFFKEIQNTGAIDEESLETNKDFRKARAETQRNRFLETTEAFVKSNNPGAGGLRDSRGNLNAGALQSNLKATAGSGTANADLAKFLLSFFEKANNTTAKEGVKPIVGRVGGTSTGADLETGLKEGVKYETYAGGTAGEKAARGKGIYGVTRDKTFKGEFTTSSNIGQLFKDKGIANGPVYSTSSNPDKLSGADAFAKTFQDMKDKDAKKAEDVAKQTQAAIDAASKTAEVLANTTLKVNVSVSDVTDALGGRGVLKQIEALFNAVATMATHLKTNTNQIAATNGAPNPPSSSQQAPIFATPGNSAE